jgi:uncharacterized protein YcbX
MPHLARLAIHPVKSLDPARRPAARVVENGGLAGDREYAVVDGDGAYVNGKRTDAVHRLRATYGFAKGRPSTVALRALGGDPPAGRFPLPDEGALADWFSSYFDLDVGVRRERAGGMPDDTDASGPTVISTATVEAVADWFDLAPGDVRRRFRANLEVGGVEPFWEDRLYAADGPVAFRVGDVRLVGDGPCNRCVVPTRDPYTGERDEGFQSRFAELRAEHLPPWAPAERFDHHFKLTVNTRVPESEWGETLAVGDEVTVEGPLD